jgi:hypothetical protein
MQHKRRAIDVATLVGMHPQRPLDRITNLRPRVSKRRNPGSEHDSTVAR